MTRNINHRRRRENKTDYQQRLKLLKSGKDRLVVRKHLNRTVAQIVRWNEEGDETVLTVSSKDIREFGWKGHSGNLPAAYLTGYLLGKKALEKDIKDCVLDIGLQKNDPGNRVYALVKGAVDAGLNVPHGESMLPSEERTQGKHIEDYASQMSETEKEEQFSKYMERGLDPENISENFEQTKEQIDGE